LIYLDRCLVIYLNEGPIIWKDATRALMVDHSSSRFVISALVKAECLVKPMKTADIAAEQSFYDQFSDLAVLPMPDAVFIDAARLRAKHGIKLPDGLHIACAQHHGCAQFWTNDDRLSALGSFVKRIAP
jgi:uncharacterized protein